MYLLRHVKSRRLEKFGSSRCETTRCSRGTMSVRGAGWRLCNSRVQESKKYHKEMYCFFFPQQRLQLPGYMKYCTAPQEWVPPRSWHPPPTASKEMPVTSVAPLGHIAILHWKITVWRRQDMKFQTTCSYANKHGRGRVARQEVRCGTT